jgi:hypothetical protein
MKAIVIKQPFANLILQNQKTIELRSFNTSHRGELLIVAAKKDYTGNVLITCHDEAAEWTCKEHIDFWEDHDEVFLRGHAICVVTITDSRPMTFDDEQPACHRVFPNAKAWALENLRRIKPFPVIGKQGIFEVPDSLIEFEGPCTSFIPPSNAVEVPLPLEHLNDADLVPLNNPPEAEMNLICSQCGKGIDFNEWETLNGLCDDCACEEDPYL